MSRTRPRLLALVCALLATLALATPAWADTGPKPTVTVTVTGLPAGPCYGTLLSQEESTGPASAYDATADNKYVDEGGEEVWQAFQDYAATEPDGYHFLQWTFDVAADGAIAWTYFPPSPFKVALYFPQTGAVLTSGVLERDAFASTYELDLAGVDTTTSADGVLQVRDTSSLAAALPGAVLRLALTVAIELAVVWAFGYREKNMLAFALLVNVATQLALNARLVMVGYQSGQMAADFALVGLEVIVFAVEAVLFAWWLGGHDQRKNPRGRAALCALAANAASLVAGLFL